MSTERETTRVVRSWLEAGVTRLPDRVLDAVLDQVPATPQRRPFWRARRFPQMTNPVRYAIAAAAVLVVALIGYQFLPTSDIGAPPSAATTAAPTGGPTIAPSPIPRLPGEGSRFPAGTYILTGDFADDYIIDVPEAWTTCCGGMLVKGDAAALLYGDITGHGVPADACQWKSGGQSKPQGAAAFAAAFAAQVDRNASTPRNVTVAGLPAVHVRVSVPADQEFTEAEGFVGCDDGEFVSMTTETGERDRYHQFAGQIDDFYLIDLDGKTYIVIVITGPDTSASDMTEVQAMLDSIRRS